MSENSRTELVFEGSKFFWRTRNNIDVTIVSHIDSATIEVIAYEPSIDVEAERIYLSSHVVSSKLNHDEIEAKFSFAKQNNVAHTEEFETEVIKRATSDFILNHLFIKEYSKDDRKFAVQLQFRENTSDENSPIICDKPAELLPFETKHFKLFTPMQVSEALKALENEQSNLEEQCTKAIEMQAQAGVQLSHKERWRIPLVLGKLAKNKTLNETDSKIWSAVSSNLKTQQDIDTITKVTLRIVTSPRPVTPTRNGNRTPNRARSNGPTPNRSPCITPRLTPRSRANSQRLFNGTISSQNRAQSFAEDDTSAAPTPRKLSKRASSKGGHKNPKPKGTKARAPTSPSSISTGGIGIPSEEDALGDGDGIAAFESEKTTSLAEQVTTSMNSFTATISAKLRGTGSTKDPETSTIHCKESAYIELPEQNRNLQGGAHGASASTDAGEEAALVGVGDNVRVKPSKRRSFFGSLLASFGISTSSKKEPVIVLTDSAGAHAQAGTGTGEQPTALTLSKKQPSKKMSIGSGSGKGLTLSAALAAWFPWSHSAAVVPVDLTERDPVELSVN